MKSDEAVRALVALHRLKEKRSEARQGNRLISIVRQAELFESILLTVLDNEGSLPWYLREEIARRLEEGPQKATP